MRSHGTRPRPPGAAGAGAAGAIGARASVFRNRRLRIVLIELLALLLIVVVFAGATGDDPPADAPMPVADDLPAARSGKADGPTPKKTKEAKQRKSGARGNPGRRARYLRAVDR